MFIIFVVGLICGKKAVNLLNKKIDDIETSIIKYTIDDTNTDEPEVKDLDTDKKTDVKKNDDKKVVESKTDSNDSKLGKKLNLLLLGLGITVVIVSIVLIKKNKDQLYKN